MSNGELIAGAPAIAKFMGCEPDQVYYMAARGLLPIIKIGNRWCLRPSTYEKFCTQREQAALEAKEA